MRWSDSTDVACHTVEKSPVASTPSEITRDIVGNSPQDPLLAAQRTYNFGSSAYIPPQPGRILLYTKYPSLRSTPVRRVESYLLKQRDLLDSISNCKHHISPHYYPTRNMTFPFKPSCSLRSEFSSSKSLPNLISKFKFPKASLDNNYNCAPSIVQITYCFSSLRTRCPTDSSRTHKRCGEKASEKKSVVL